jgi:hypothetical protein
MTFLLFSTIDALNEPCAASRLGLNGSELETMADSGQHLHRHSLTAAKIS